MVLRSRVILRALRGRRARAAPWRGGRGRGGWRFAQEFQHVALGDAAILGGALDVGGAEVFLFDQLGGGRAAGPTPGRRPGRAAAWGGVHAGRGAAGGGVLGCRGDRAAPSAPTRPSRAPTSTSAPSGAMISAQDAGRGGVDFHRYLVGFKLDHGLVGGHGLAAFFDPAGDCRGGHALPRVGTMISAAIRVT